MSPREGTPGLSTNTYPSRQAALDELAALDLKVGDADVRCERDEPARGTWSRFAGRVGRIVSTHLQTLGDGRTEVELGVKFTHRGSEPSTWFRPFELERCYGADEARGGPATSGRAS